MKPNTTGDKTSLIRPYSLGVAAANLVFGQKELEVTPIEDLSQLDGEVTDAQSTLKAQGVDKAGNAYETAQTVSNSIKATWLSLDTYRPFPGLIRRGERVMIWRVGDTDKYYWTEMGLDDKTRRRDIYTVLIPNSSKEGENSRTASTAYFIEVNTIDKHITIQTNKNDGEKFAYMLQLNAGGSNLTLCDDAGNYFQLDSLNQSLKMKNQVNSEISIIKTKALISTVDEIALKSKAVNITAETMTVNAKNYTETSTSHSTTTKSYSLSSQTGTYTVATYSINGATLTHNGLNVGSTHKHLLGSTPTSPPM